MVLRPFLGGRLAMTITRRSLICGGIALFALTGCSMIPTGHTGIEWTPTHGTINRPWKEGIHVVSPFAKVYKVDLRKQEHEEPVDVLANNGLDIKLTSSILYQPSPDQVYQLMTETGQTYYETLIAPYVRSSARKVVGRYTPEEIYSTKREQIEHEIRQEVSQKLTGKHVNVNAILIREVHLPIMVQKAIQTKLEEEQKALEMKYVLDRTRQEAERQRIEAGGIADFQAIVSKGLTDQLLQWKGIDATEKLATSPNTKVIIVGSGKNGLPVILNTAGAAGMP
jgi:regulator of protease activity HflC (stomatin/prohibitin superfamily)